MAKRASISSSQSVAKRHDPVSLTPSEMFSPEKRQDFLRPWFKLANAMLGFYEKNEAALPEPREIERLVRDAGHPAPVHVSPDVAKSQNYELASNVCGTLRGLARGKRITVAVRTQHLISSDGNRLTVRRWSPFEAFEDALQKTETDRIRSCEVCGQLFYAVRKDKTCCSTQCAHVRRQHRFAGNWEKYQTTRQSDRRFRKRIGLSAVIRSERSRIKKLNAAIRETQEQDEPSF
jgi:hypothetical protein